MELNKRSALRAHQFFQFLVKLELLNRSDTYDTVNAIYNIFKYVERNEQSTNAKRPQ